MRAVVQRVLSASVDADEQRIASIGVGLVVLLGVGDNDHPEDGERIARKIAQLRIFPDDAGRFSRSLQDTAASVLAIPQFTLYGDVRRGRRPDFTHAAPPERAQTLFDAFCGALRAERVELATGRFGAHMRISMEADGPVTIVASTDGWQEAEI